MNERIYKGLLYFACKSPIVTIQEYAESAFIERYHTQTEYIIKLLVSWGKTPELYALEWAIYANNYSIAEIMLNSESIDSQQKKTKVWLTKHSDIITTENYYL